MAPLRQRGDLAGGKAVVVDRLEHHRLALGEVAAVVFYRRAGARLHRRRVGHGRRRDQIAPPDLGPVETYAGGGDIEQPLDGERALRIAGAPDRHGRHLVGLDRDHSQRIARHLVGTRQGGRRVVGDVDALRRVGTLVVEQRAAHAEDRTLAVERDLEVPLLIAFLDRGQKVLAAVLDPFDRAAEQAGCERHHHLLGIDQVLGAEAATDIGRDDAQLLVVQPEQLHQRHADLVRALRRGPHRGPPLARIVAGKHAAAFHRMGAAAVLEQRQRDPVGGGRERTLAVAVGNRVFGQDVARHPPVHRRRVGRNRGAQVRHRRQRLELDLDALRRVLGDRAARPQPPPRSDRRRSRPRRAPARTG